MLKKNKNDLLFYIPSSYAKTWGKQNFSFGSIHEVGEKQKAEKKKKKKEEEKKLVKKMASFASVHHASRLDQHLVPGVFFIFSPFFF